MSFFSSFKHWMTTSSSIIGTAVATPTIAAALSGTVSWSHAIFPLVGAAVSILMPQTAAPKGSADAATQPVVPFGLRPLFDVAAAVGAATGTSFGLRVAATAPGVADLLATAAADYATARDKLLAVNHAMHGSAPAPVPAPVPVLVPVPVPVSVVGAPVTPYPYTLGTPGAGA